MIEIDLLVLHEVASLSISSVAVIVRRGWRINLSFLVFVSHWGNDIRAEAAVSSKLMTFGDCAMSCRVHDK